MFAQPKWIQMGIFKPLKRFYTIVFRNKACPNRHQARYGSSEDPLLIFLKTSE